MGEEHEHRTEDEVLDEQNAEAVEDLDVPDGGQDAVAGGGTDMWIKTDDGGGKK